MNCINILKLNNRNRSLEVIIGNIILGGNNPVRIQSMTNTNTNDIASSIKQCIELIQGGSELVRLTTQGIREVESMIKIQNELHKSGYLIPLIADVHFSPKVAVLAAQHFAKVRINPGNYAEKATGKTEFSEDEFQQGITRIKNNLIPLLSVCKKNNTALRIGINHGSLSERIMSRYGDTPEGMVESALEFLRICREENFHKIVVSIKASNVLVMVQSYRLLVQKMNEEKMYYPLHLGVTEAGEGEDGRIKSAVGIGALLIDGIGDTIRVSLTENPVKEIPVARKIVEYIAKNNKPISEDEKLYYNPFVFNKRITKPVDIIGGTNQPVVIIDGISSYDLHFKDQLPDFVFINKYKPETKLPENLNIIINHTHWCKNKSENNLYPLIDDKDFENNIELSERLNFIKIGNRKYSRDFFNKVLTTKCVLILITKEINGYADQRAFFNSLLEFNIQVPVIIQREYEEDEQESFQIKSACDIGPLFIDGFGDGIYIKNKGDLSANTILSASFSILQATRARITKTEYISCPGCGRTLYNLEEVVLQIKEKTSRLKGLKIAIMGCIVNGPGEMADADYGYIGAGHGKVMLYKKHELIKKNIPSEIAVDELIRLIKENGDWKE